MWYENLLAGGSASPGDWDVAGLAYVYLPCQACGYATLLMCLENSRPINAAAQPLRRLLCGVQETSLRLSRRSRRLLLATCVVGLALIFLSRLEQRAWVAFALLLAAAGYILRHERELRRSGDTVEEIAMRRLAGMQWTSRPTAVTAGAVAAS